MKWFKKLPRETQLYLLQIINLLGTMNWMYLAMRYDAWSIYLLAIWTFISAIICMRDEEKLYRENIQT